MTCLASENSSKRVPAILVAVLGLGLLLTGGIFGLPPVHAQSASDFFLHGAGPDANPPTLFLNTTAPTATTAKYKDSTKLKFSVDNAWKKVGTWAAQPALTVGPLSAVSDLHVWLGLKSSADQGATVDLRAELYKNGTLLTSSLSRCLTGLSGAASLAQAVTVPFGAVVPVSFNGTTDQLVLKLEARIGTNPDDTQCSGPSIVAGLRLFFDSTTRQARFGATIGAANLGPTAVPGGPYSGNVGQPIQFNGSGSSDPENNPLTFTWNFGDGATGTGPTPTHAYSTPGTFTVSLTVDDGQGNTHTATTLARILDPLTQARVSHTATLLPNGTVLLAGGTGPTGVLSSAERFDPITLSATALTSSLTTARTEHTATLLPQTETLLIAGQDSLGLLFSTEMFNPGTQTFRALSPNVQVLRSGHTATGLLDGRVLITGGQSSGTLSTVEGFDAQTAMLFKPSYDPEAGIFTILPNGLVTPRWDHTATLLPDGRILIAGGRNDSGVLASAELFDPATEQFTALSGALTTPRAGHTATLLPDGRVLILGGEVAGGVLATAEVFTPATGTYTSVTPGLNTPRVNHAATLLPTGFVLITGGQNATGMLASTELYTPTPADTMAPVVNQVTPPSAPLGVDRTEIISVRFSEPVDVRTLTAASVTPTGGGPVAATMSPGEQGLMVFLVPTVPLAAGTTYTLSLTSEIKDTSGNALTPFTSQFTTVAAPTITSFTPDTGQPGTAVTITGANFDPFVVNNEVKFNGVLASVTSASAMTLTALVPGGATTGPISVTTRGGTATSATNFTVITVPPPTISGFSPVAGHLGALVTVTGTNFDPNPSGNQVTIGGVAASVQFATTTQMVVSVPAVAMTGLLVVTTAGGQGQSATAFTVIAMTGLTVTPAQATLPVGASQAFRGTATFTDQSTSDVTSLLSWMSSTPGSASVTAAGVAQGVAVGTATITGSLGTFNAAGAVQVIAATPGDPVLPSDPVTVAPPINQTVPTSLFDSTAFLYTGANPIQTGVAAGTIKTQQAAVVRGSVRGGDGFPIPGVTVTVLNHPEFGQTVTRPDGMFDLAINGGGLFTVNYAKAGYSSLQRQVHVPWQDFTQLPEVVMVPLDTQVTTITANAPTMQTARGNVVTDTSGTRQATLLIPAATTATMTLPGGGTQPLSTLTVRATEFTVGPNGPKAMPQELPRSSAYTYAVDFTVDEALAAGATDVQFNQPVINYLENFLNWSVGATVPVGYYDRARGVWVPSANGQVIKVVSITGDLADVDTDGDNVADSGLGITTEERQRLASLYTVGQTIWRVPITHVTPYDFNAGYAPTPGATDPGLDVPPPPESNCQNQQPGSVITCEYQTVGENVSVTGTPFRLHYQSDRVPGRKDSETIPIPLSKATLPPGLTRIDLEIHVAGRIIASSFTPAPNQSTTFTWDHKDAYGRELQGEWPITVRVGYIYPTVFYGATPVFGAYATGTVLSASAARREFTLAQQWIDQRGIWNAQAQGLGGWTLDMHHAYDPIRQILHRGDGAKRTSTVLGATLVTVTGTPTPGFSGDGGPASLAQVYQPFGVAAAPDGTLYIADTFNNRIRRIDPNGIITTFAGTGTPGYNGDGIPAVQAQVCSPTGIALGPDTSLYIADECNERVRKIDPAGIITTIAGNGTFGYGGDGGPATQAQFKNPWGVAVAPDGSVYIADYQNARVRKVATDGIITTVAGTGVVGFSGDGGPASQANLNLLWGGVAVDQNGVLYIADTTNHCVRAVTTSGIISTFAGQCGAAGLAGDGGVATSALLFNPVSVTTGPDGTVYILDVNTHRVRKVTNNGIITTLAGISANPFDQGFSGDNGPPSAARLYWPSGLAVAPDGSIVFADRGNSRIRRIKAPLPGFAPGEIFMADEQGNEVFVFDSQGRHLRTLDALTNAIRYQFAYDSSGFLTTMTDADGKVTTIERTGSTPSAIVAPGGQRTTLSIEANGYLAAIANPNNEKVELTYSVDGLLATMKDARANQSAYTYDPQGRLTRADDPATGFKTLARTEQSTGWTVTLNTALNRTTSYQVENLVGGDQRQKTTAPTGLVTTSLFGANKTTTITGPDGTVTTPVQGPDPRWGMQAPLLNSLSVRAPSGLTSTLTTTRAVTLSNPNDLLSLSTQTDTLVINGRTYTSTYTQSTRLLSTTTPAGRTSSVTLDTKGRVVQEQVTGLEAVSYSYDVLGRLATITQGTGATARTSTLAYNTKNELISITDPLSRTVAFAYDLAGRITTQTLPDTRTIGYNYDANGNVTGITPPGRPAHAFSYTPVDLEQDYSPPDAGFSPRNTQYTYNLDRQLTLVTRPDSQTIALGYDAGGRLSTLTLPGNLVTTYAYGATTGTLSSITAPGSTLSYTYDGSLLKTTTWSGTMAGSVSRNYDANFRVTSQSVNGANTVSFGYDLDSLLTSAGALAITRSPQHGLITGTTLGVSSDTRTYSTFGELSHYTAGVSGTAVLDVQYTRDKLGRITQKIESIGGTIETFDYTYDQAGRLTEVKRNGTVSATYAYDSNGNRLSLTTPSGTTSGTYDAQDRLTQYGGTTYGYSANGELQSTTTSGQTTTYTYDVLGNLKSVVGPTGFTIEYVIDGQNRRIGKKVNGTLTQGWLYQNQLNPVTELDGTGAVVSRFVYGTKANVPDYIIKSGITYRIVSDHLGSPRLVVNTGDGSVAQRIDYDEFGQITSDTSPGFQPFGFAGGLYDTHTGLVRFGARDYDAVTGRWTAKDPILFQGGNANIYAYVVNDPVNLSDQSGLFLENIFSGPLDAHSNDAVNAYDFVQHAGHKSLNDLQHEASHGPTPDSRAGGPHPDFRYVRDPADPNAIIDMRHFLVVGQRGELFGLAIEIAQTLDPNNPSAFDPQDFYSNALGAEFFKNYDPRKPLADQLRSFFQKRVKGICPTGS